MPLVQNPPQGAISEVSRLVIPSNLQNDCLAGLKIVKIADVKESRRIVNSACFLFSVYYFSIFTG